MILAIISLSYPYGNGDPFLEDELRTIENEFQHIYIIPLKKADGERHYMPPNAELISIGSNCFSAWLCTAASLPEIIKEVAFGRKNGYRNLLRMVHRALNYELAYHSCKRILSSLDQCILYGYWLSEPAYIIARSQNKNCLKVSRAHGYDCFKDRGYNPFRREIIEQLDAIYSISDIGREDMLRNLIPLSRSKKIPSVQISHLGVRINETVNPAKGTSFRIVTCSNVVKIKRLDLLVDAMSQLVTDKPVEWIHFGGGKLLDVIVESASQIMNPLIQITFHGSVPHRQILEYYEQNHVDLFINCSDAEGIPVSMMEAMGYGIPCIARNVGGISELIDSGVNGYLLPAGESVGVLCAQIEHCIKHGIDDAMRQNAREKAKELFSVQNYTTFARDMISKYEKHFS